MSLLIVHLLCCSCLLSAGSIWRFANNELRQKELAPLGDGSPLRLVSKQQRAGLVGEGRFSEQLSQKRSSLLKSPLCLAKRWSNGTGTANIASSQPFSRQQEAPPTS